MQKEKKQVIFIASLLAFRFLFWLVLVMIGTISEIWLLGVMGIIPCLLLIGLYHVTKERLTEMKEEEKNDYHNY